jgi:uncharacterized membrane protein
MTVILLCFLLGCVTGLRSLTAPAVVCWAARFGWIHLAETKLSFLGNPATLVVITLLALGELVTDKLPRTPARTSPPGLIARVLLGGFCGLALVTSTGGSLVAAAVAGVAGALVGTFVGYNIRRALVMRAHPDFAVAASEDLVAIAGGLLIVSRL